MKIGDKIPPHLRGRVETTRQETSGWAPIETVPVGEKVLLFEDGDYYAGVCTSPGDEDDPPIFGSNCGQPVCVTPEPSHWMPLPSPPVKP